MWDCDYPLIRSRKGRKRLAYPCLCRRRATSGMLEKLESWRHRLSLTVLVCKRRWGVFQSAEIFNKIRIYMTSTINSGETISRNPGLSYMAHSKRAPGSLFEVYSVGRSVPISQADLPGLRRLSKLANRRKPRRRLAPPILFLIVYHERATDKQFADENDRIIKVRILMKQSLVASRRAGLHGIMDVRMFYFGMHKNRPA